MLTRVQAAVGLGANLGDPPRQLAVAMAALQDLELTRLLKQSGIYRSPPMGGPAGQPDYANAAVLLDTALAPLELLQALQAIEAAQGRIRRERWGPRLLDLDLLCVGALRLCHPQLQLPHPGIGERAFVLQPLAEIAPDLQLPGLGSVQACLTRLHTPALPLWET